MSTGIDSIHPTNHLLNIKEILLNTIGLCRDNISLFLAICMLGALPDLLSIYCSERLNSILAMVSLSVRLWANAALIFAASKIHRNETISITESFISIKGKYWRFTGVSLILVFATLLGLLVFIIPGIYLGVFFCLSDIAVIIEEREKTGAFKLSNKLVRGFFWKTFWLLVIIMLPHLISILFLTTLFPAVEITWIDPEMRRILLITFSSVCVLFFTVGRVLLYHKLKELKAVELSKNPDALNKSPYGCLLGVGLAIGVGLLIVLWTSLIGRFK